MKVESKYANSILKTIGHREGGHGDKEIGKGIPTTTIEGILILAEMEMKEKMFQAIGTADYSLTNNKVGDEPLMRGDIEKEVKKYL